jgi:hypothetical protein
MMDERQITTSTTPIAEPQTLVLDTKDGLESASDNRGDAAGV